ncbi:MAG: hypothetical protein VX938_06050, partial [Myxococcota bacterium]|nr:hypothetical protein [Myxococcota bacterium]
MEILLDFVERGYERRALAWAGQDPAQRQVALQVAERRFVRGVPRGIDFGAVLTGLTAFEWRAAWGMYAREWAAVGAKVSWTWAPGVTADEQLAICGEGMPLATPIPNEVFIWSTSFTQDLTGKEVGYATESVKSLSPRVVVTDFPPRAPWKQWLEALKDLGYISDTQEVLSTEHGDPVAANRVLVHAERKDAWKGDFNVAVLGALTRQDRPCGIIGAMSRPGRGAVDGWLAKADWELVINPRINTTGEIMLPWPRGKLKHRTTGELALCYNPQGPALTPSAKTIANVAVGVGLFLCTGGEGTGVRPLRCEEILRAWGAEWKSIRGQGTRELTLTIRSAPRETVRAIVARTAARVVEGVITETRSEKVGMCEHPEEVAVRDRARQWFRAWRRDPDWPAATWGIPRKQDRAKTETEQGPPGRGDTDRLVGSEPGEDTGNPEAGGSPIRGILRSTTG